MPNNTLSYPKVCKNRLGKYYIDFKLNKKRYRLFGGKLIGSSLLIHSYPKHLRRKQASALAEQVYRHLIANDYFLCGVAFLLTYLMNADLPLFSLKFKEYSIKNNATKYFFLATSLLLLIFLHYTSIPLIVLFYVVLSMIINYKKES